MVVKKTEYADNRYWVFRWQHQIRRFLSMNEAPKSASYSTVATLQIWEGILEIGSGWAVWRGSVGDTSAHQHFAAQAVLSDKPLTLLDRVAVEHSAITILIDPHVVHRLMPAEQATIVFIEPRRIPAIDMPTELMSQLRKRAARSLHLSVASSSRTNFWSTWLASENTVMSSDPWEDTVREVIDHQLSEGVLHLSDIAQHVHLSSERFRHLFPERIGMSFRRFVLWRRLRCAAQSLQAGNDATSSAHRAGFSDAAHFARTLRSNFGVTAMQSFRR